VDVVANWLDTTSGVTAQAVVRKQNEAEAWTRYACYVATALRARTALPEINVYGPVFRPGERAFFQESVNYARMYGGDGTYTTTGLLALGSRGFMLGSLAAASSTTAARLGPGATRPWCGATINTPASSPPAGRHARSGQLDPAWLDAYFRHAVASGTFDHLQKFVWWRIVRWQRAIHRWRWTDVRRWLTDPTGRWHPISADGITLFNPAAVPIRRYPYRSNAIPTPRADAG
jgi:hypothetical protein